MSRVENSDSAIAIQGLANFNEDLSDISFPLEVSLNYFQFTILISLVSSFLIKYFILKINTDLNVFNYFKVIVYSFLINTGVFLSSLYLLRFYNFPRSVIILQLILYPLVFGFLIIFLNLFLKNNSFLFINKYLSISISLLSVLFLGFITYQQFDSSRLIAQRVVETESEQGLDSSTLEIALGDSGDGTGCFKWSGSDNYKSCITDIKLKQTQSSSSGSFNNIVIFDSDIYYVMKSGVIFDKNNSIFLDISERVKQDASESGLYDIQFNPNNKSFLISYSNIENSLIFEEFLLNDENEYKKGEVLLDIPNPSFNHYCGAIEWSEFFNGYLICVGDMGTPNKAIDTSSQKGKILFLNSFYTTKIDKITESNNNNELDNILAFGLRNPWNFKEVGDLLIVPDVGEKSNEELNIVDLNKIKINNTPFIFGWPVYEGSLLSENSEYGLKNWSNNEYTVKDYIVSNAISPNVFYDRPAPENNRAAIIGTVFISNENSKFDKNIIFADYLSKELFAYDYLKDELSIISLPPFPGYLTALSNHPINKNIILIATVSNEGSFIYEITLPEN